jgi:hypothetical protein
MFRIPHREGVAQLVERVLYHSTRRAVPERSWVQSLLPSTEVAYLWWYASPGAAADQPGVQDWYIPIHMFRQRLSQTNLFSLVSHVWIARAYAIFAI